MFWPLLLALTGMSWLIDAAVAATTDGASISTFVTLFKDVGVPAGMLAWFALRVERKLDQSDKRLEEIKEVLAAGQVKSAEAMQRVASCLEQIDDHLGSKTPPMGIPALSVSGR